MRASRQHRMRRARFLTGQTRSPGGVRCRVPPLRPFVDPDSSPTAPPTCATPITQMEHRCCCSINAGAMNAPGRTRTCDRRLRRPMLYPAELQAQTTREGNKHGAFRPTANGTPRCRQGAENVRGNEPGWFPTQRVEFTNGQARCSGPYGCGQGGHVPQTGRGRTQEIAF